MAKRPTIVDLAKHAGLSTATVDRVLNGRKNVRDETARKVLVAAEELGYHATNLIKKQIMADLPECRFGLLLQKEGQEFYQSFAKSFLKAVKAQPQVRGSAEIIFAKSQDPGEHSELIRELGKRNTVVAATAVNHQSVTRAVKDLRQAGKATFSLLNDFAQGERHSYVGLNNLKVGRLAGWMIGNIVKNKAKVAVFVGGSRWHGHELRETGIRSFIRESAPHLHMMETLVNLETRQYTYEATLELLERHSDIRGIFVAGGGMEGAIQALRESRSPGEVVLVVNELTEVSRIALEENIVTLVNATPLDELCTALSDAMVQSCSSRDQPPLGQIFIQPRLYLPESQL